MGVGGGGCGVSANEYSCAHGAAVQSFFVAAAAAVTSSAVAVITTPIQ